MSASQDLFAFDIGLADGRFRLNCCINLHEKSFRYYKSRRMLPAFDPTLRVKKWAFDRLRRHSNMSFSPSKGAFLPGELFQGNLHIIHAFLQHLRNQKVESFIHLGVLQCSKESPFQKMGNILCKILQRKRYDFFRRTLSSNRSQNIRQKQLKVTCKGKKQVETTLILQANHSVDSTPSKTNARSLSITYTRIDLSEEKSIEKKAESHSMEKSKHLPSPTISIRRLEQKSHRKMYTFESVKHQWSKQIPSKDLKSHF